jgi:hypothetical protein
LIYDFEQDTVIGGKAMLCLLGLPVSDLTMPSISAADTVNLAGEAMFAPNIAQIIISIYLIRSASWWSGSKPAAAKCCIVPTFPTFNQFRREGQLFKSKASQ